MFKRIRKLQKQCGTYAVAKHLKARHFTLEQALFVLARQKQ